MFKFIFYRPNICFSIYTLFLPSANNQTWKRHVSLNLTRVFAFLGFIFPQVYQLLYYINKSNDNSHVQSALSCRVLSQMLSCVIPITIILDWLLPTCLTSLQQIICNFLILCYILDLSCAYLYRMAFIQIVSSNQLIPVPNTLYCVRKLQNIAKIVQAID